MKIRLVQQILKKTVTFAMAVSMTAVSIGTLITPKEIKAAESAITEDFEETYNNWSFIKTGEIVQDPDSSKDNKVLKVKLDNVDWGYSRWEVALKPNTSYMMEVKVKGDINSLQNQFSDGVYINLEGSNGYPMDYENNFQTEDFDWITMKMYFYTNSRGKTNIQCGLGDCSGTAYFDDIKITEYTYTEADKEKRIIGETENIRLSLKPETITESGISEEKYQQLLNNLQSTYEAYYELTGSAPFYGDKLNMLETFQPAYLKYGAVSGNTIRLSNSQVEALQAYMESGFVNFGWLHEIGHDFDNGSELSTGRIYNYGWDFHDEFWANTKMLYVLDTTDVSTNIGEITADSLEEILPYYKRNYDKWKADENGLFGDSYHDALTYIFGTIAKDIGWEPFVKTFHQFTAGEIPTPATRLAMLERFLYGLQQNYNPGGNEVKSYFQEGEYEAIYNYYWYLDENGNVELDGRKYLADEGILNLVGDKEYPEVIKNAINSEKQHILYAGSQEELDQIIENVKTVVSPITVSYKDYDEKVIAVQKLQPGAEIPTNIASGEREYYTFEGWYMDKEGTIPAEQGTTETLEKEITIYSKWKLNNYTIHYELNGGTNSDSNPVAFSGEDGMIVFADPVKEGYTFEGWYRNADFTKRIYDFEAKDFSEEVLENFTVYAKWEEKQATVTPEPTVTVTPEPTVTVTPEPTATVTPEPTATVTPEPTATVTPEPTATVTPEPTVTVTPEPTVTVTPEPTATVTPEPTVTVTLEPTATATPEPTATATPEPTATATPKPTSTAMPEPTKAPKKVSIKKAKVAKLSAQYYYGKAVKPEVKVTYQGKTLKKGTDYKLSYKNNKKAGTGKITIIGKGNYTGTKTVTFKIVNGYVKYKVTSKTALYKTASDKSKKLTTLSKGKKVKVYVGSEVKDSKKKKWVKVKVGSKTGYVLKKKLEKVSEN
ncbi:MAG: InlB B-repeat-containing protein [Lachnospiraceae bacterium]|nr:InlB B-repeat-containing protein [Lachnospiraceae bacterium]